ncbi:MAG: DNA alkylation repair protein [Methanomethylophilus sp.]
MNQPELDARLAARIDLKYRDFSRRLTPCSLPLLGVRRPALQQLVREIEKDDWRTFLALPATSFEQSVIRSLIVARAPMSGAERLSRTETLLPELDNWAVIDSLCAAWHIDSPATAEVLWQWSTTLLDTGQEFPMRIGAVMIMDKFRDCGHLAAALRLLTTTHNDAHYYRMGQAWALSFFYISFPAETEAALFDGNLSLPELKLTVSKIRDSYRVPADEKQRLTARVRALTEK